MRNVLIILFAILIILNIADGSFTNIVADFTDAIKQLPYLQRIAVKGMFWLCIISGFAFSFISIFKLMSPKK